METITTGMGWERIHPPVIIIGSPGREDLQVCWELGATLAATLM